MNVCTLYFIIPNSSLLVVPFICSFTSAIAYHHHSAVADFEITKTGRIQEEKQEIPHLLSSGDCLDEYVVSSLISIGGFGQVYTGYHRTTHMRVAIKVETLLAPIPLLRNEAACLHYLNSRHNEDGRRPREPILRYMAYGKTEKLKYLVMDHSGANLRELKRATPKDQFSMTTSLWIMERMLSALQFVHGHGWLHRDIKPANFCIGDHESHKLYLIDFGMCRYFLNTDGSYKMRKPSCPFHGTVRYASLNSHKRQDQCRWDDLWSVYYITIENMVGALPWRFVTDKNVVAEMKATYPFSSLQYGEEPCMPRPLQMLSHHLHEAYLEHDTSFYATPPYGGIIREVIYDLEQRHFYRSSKLDWEKERSPGKLTPSCYGDCDEDRNAPPSGEHPLLQIKGKQSFYYF
ncbi:hypothetical protein Q1695_014283 [Nippostrongylus brasiliensis]|nr:hypothetical protein Q1695_014283 [Nippostrongylus brasiliensis]